MTDQFDTWRTMVDIAKRHGSLADRRTAYRIANITANDDAVPDPISGYYRNRRNADGRYAKDAPFAPVAIYRDGEELVVMWGGVDARLESVWPYCMWHPVPFEWYDGKIKGRPWPDEHELPKVEGPEIGPGHNEPPLDPVEAKRLEIETAAKMADDYVDANGVTKIDSDEKRDKAQSAYARLLELKNSADKTREAAIRPHIDAQKKNNNTWNPLVNMAKAAADRIRKAQEDWETVKLKRRRAEEARIAEENRRAALAKLEEEAAAATAVQPGSPLEAITLKPTMAPAATPAPAPTAPASTSFRGAIGRAGRVGTREVITVVDHDKTYQHFRERVEVRELLRKLAQQIVDDTGEVVPGCTAETVAKIKS